MIGADTTINPEIELQGLASTDPALLQESSMAGLKTGAELAQVPSQMRLNEAQAWMISADAYWKNWMDNLLPAAKNVDKIVADRLKQTFDPPPQSGSTATPSGATANAPTSASVYGYNQNVQPSTGPMISGGPNG